MFDAFSFVSAQTGLNLPDDYDTRALVDMTRKAYNEGADFGADSANAAPLIDALKKIQATTTDPVARLTAERALINFEAGEL